MTKAKKLTVAHYLDQLISMSPLSQKDIAAAVGYEKPNIITMMKQGHVKVPLNRVGALAKALHVDPVHLLRLTMSEYMPSTWDAISEVIGDQLVSASDRALLEVVHKEAGEVDIPMTDARRRELAKLVKEWAAEERKAAPAVGRDMRRKQVASR